MLSRVLNEPTYAAYQFISKFIRKDISFLELALKDFRNDMEITTKGAVKV